MPGGQYALRANHESGWQTPFAPICWPGPQTLPAASCNPDVEEPPTGAGRIAASTAAAAKIIAKAPAIAASEPLANLRDSMVFSSTVAAIDPHKHDKSERPMKRMRTSRAAECGDIAK